MYLCHTFCELGATPLGDGLAQINDFLAANRGEVVAIVNEDYVTPKDFVRAVTDAGLDDFVYRGPTSGSWPTLGHMVETNQRLLFWARTRRAPPRGTTPRSGPSCGTRPTPSSARHCSRRRRTSPRAASSTEGRRPLHCSS